MGPPFITAEWLERSLTDTPSIQGASMGPPFITAEWPRRINSPGRRHTGFNGAAVHHGGVGPRQQPSKQRPPCFNGAAVHHGGVASGCSDRDGAPRASMGPPFITAEWQIAVDAINNLFDASMGPPFITAEWAIEADGQDAEDHRASMGPPFITAEWMQAPPPGSTYSVGRFNGAAVHHGGVGGGRVAALPYGGCWASMGPPFITAEWATI